MTNPITARFKAAVIQAVDINGGVDGAAATTDRSRSTTGRWRNLNDPDYPPLDRAFLLDQVAVAQGKEPPLLKSYARALGYSVMPHGYASDAHTGLLQSMAILPKVTGDLQSELALSLQDATIDAQERKTLIAKTKDSIDELNKILNMLGGAA